MIINFSQGEKCQAVLTVEIPAETVKAERDDVVRQFAMVARVPGYRPGKVPQALIEKRFAGGIRQELERRLIEKAFKKAREKEKKRILSVLSQEATPNVDETYMVKSDLLLAPEFELPDYTGIPVTLPKQEVLDEHLERIIDQWKEQHAGYEEVEDGVLEMGRYAVVDYVGKKDGEPLVNADSPPILRAYFERTDAWMLMDEETFLPGFCGELLDHKKGEVVEFTLTLPENFPDEELRGQEIQYTVTVQKIMRKNLPEFTDEMVKETTQGKLATAEEFRLDISDRLEAEMKRRVDTMLSEQVIEYLHARVDFELPDVLVAQETQSHVNRIVSDSAERGVKEEALLAQEQQILAAADEMGRRDLKTKFILNEIAIAEGFKAEEKEVHRQVQLFASQANMSPKKAMQFLRDKGQLASINQDILFGKALAFVKEKASVSIDEAQNALDLIWDGEKSA